MGFLVASPAGGGNPGTLDWFDDFRSGTLDAEGLVNEADRTTVTVVSASGLGFPAGVNFVGRNDHLPEQDVQWVANNLWPLPAIGSHVFYRMYVRNTFPDGANVGEDHGFQCNVGDIKWAWGIGSGSGGLWSPVCDTNGAGGIDPVVTDIPKNVVQILEWRLERDSSTLGLMTFRVSNAAGTLLGEDASAPRQCTGMTDALFRTARHGIAGLGGSTYTGTGVHWGCLAARVSADANDWIGTYPVSGVED